MRKKIIILAFFLSLSHADVIVIMKNGKSVQGSKTSENANFITLNVQGSNVSILKTLIDTIKKVSSADSNQTPNTVSSSGSSPDTSEIKDSSTIIQDKEQNDTILQKSESEKNQEPKAEKRRDILRPSFDQMLHYPEKVEFLDLSYQNLKELSGKIMFFVNLKRLDLKGNSLKTLPSEIGDLTKLEDLDLRMNRIKELPPEIGNLLGLKYLFLTGNDLSDQSLRKLYKMLPYTNIILSERSGLPSKDDRQLIVSQEELKMIDSLKAQCNKGDRSACSRLGYFWEEMKDYERSLIAFESGCGLTDADTTETALSCCMEAAEFYNLIIKDKSKADKFYRHVCDKLSYHSETACDRLKNLIKK